MEFGILGPLEVREGDRILTCRGQKQRLLLAVLLLRANEVVASDRLIEALWGESPPPTAAKSLQMQISQLRNLLEPDRARGGPGRILLTRPPGYELRVDPGQLDLHRFEQAVAQARAAAKAGRTQEIARGLREALAAWRGEPLADLGFEDFVQPDIARLQELRLAALEDRIDADLALGRHTELIGELEALAARHPLRERIRAQLMHALYRSGRQAEALEVYRDTRRTLVEELGIEPGRELKDLERGILAQDPDLDAPDGERRESAPAAEPSAAPELVGRERELDELSSLLEGALAGSGALALIGGEPGIGKSRLAEALAARARELGARVLVGRCWEAGGAPPFWPWVQALRSYARETEAATLRSQVGGGAELATILPELQGLLPDLGPISPADPDRARFQLFQSVTDFLRRVADANPVALFIDDLHAADAPSLLLLRFLAAELAAAPILVVGCYRDTEVGANHPLAETLPELAREAGVRRIRLGGLSEPDTARLLELTTSRTPPAGLAARIHAETEGNPLFAGEIGRLLAGEEQMEPAGDRPGRLPIPEGVREAIGLRLQRQSEGCRQALTLASALGREFDLDALERVSGLDQDGLIEALDEASIGRLVTDVPGARGRLRFSHVLIRDTLYEALPAARRLRLHREIGEALEVVYSGNVEGHLAELAHHFLEAGTGSAEKAIAYSARAGDRAASQLAYEEAARHYGSALRLMDSQGTGDEEICELLVSLGEALSRAGDERGAKDAFVRAAALGERTGQPDKLARAALGYGGRFRWARAGTDPALVPLIERGLAAVGQGDSPARARLLARLAAAIRDEPAGDRRVAVAQEAMDIAERSGDPVALADAIAGYWIAVEGPDNVGGGVEAGERLIALGEQIGDKERVYEGHDLRLHGFWGLGDRAGIDVELDAQGALADELRQPAQRWHERTGQTVLALMEGRFDEAEKLIAEALAAGKRAQSWNAVVSYRLQLFVLARAQGRLAELEETITRSVHEYPPLLRFRCVLAHLYSELGHERDARPALDELLARDLAREHVDAEWLFSMTMLVDPCAFLRDEDAAARLYALLLPYDGLYAEAPMEAAFGSVARALGVLATTMRRFDDAERHLGGAIEMERAMRARPWVAHAQHDYAAMLLARGGPADLDRASELLAEAIGAYRELGMDTWAERAAALR